MAASQYANADGYGLGAQAVALAARYLGVPYVWGGTSPQGFDCSGLVQFVYKNLGLTLPRTSEEQAKIGITVPYSQAQPGDLLLYSYSTTNDHVGIYRGNGQQIDAPRPGRDVEIAPVDTSHLTSVVRPFPGATASTTPGATDASATTAGFTSLTKDAEGYLTGLSLNVLFTLGDVGLVVLGLWRGTKTPAST